MKQLHLLVLAAALPLFSGLVSCQSDCDALREAIRGNDMALVRHYICDEKMKWQQCPYYFNAFAEACYSGSYECVCLILDNSDVLHGFSESKRAPEYRAARYLAAAMSNPDERVPERLMQHDIGKCKYALSNALGEARNAEWVKRLLNAGADPLMELNELNGFCALCRVNRIEILRPVLERVELGKLSAQQAEALAKDAIDHADDGSRLRLLLEQGLNPNTRIQGKTLYEYAMEYVPFESIWLRRSTTIATLLEELGVGGAPRKSRS